MRIPNRVRQLRQQRNWSIQKLHEASGVSYGHISDIENGKSSPSINVTYKLARALKVDISDLFPDFGQVGVSDNVG